MKIDGLASAQSRFSPKETMDRLEAALRAAAVTVFARIDHAAGAASVGEALRPTEVLIFGNPAAGTPLMQAAQTIGIDLPLKALVWRDEANQTWISWNDPAWLAARHGLTQGSDAAISQMTAMLKKMTGHAAGQTAD
jgi:uncharacterized protein (DUF302 family)